MDPTIMMAQFAPAASGPRLQEAPLGFKLGGGPLPHRRYREAMFRMAQLHHRRRTHGAGAGLLLTGPSGAGKSTIAAAFLAAYPRVHETARTYIPVLFVSVPSSPTSRSVAGAILEALGHRRAHSGTAPEKTARIKELFKRCGVEILVLDEFQHLYYCASSAAFRDLSDWLKNLLEDTGVGMVGCGLPAAETAVDCNEQLARRFSERIRFTPFSFEDAADFQEFRGILKAFGALLPISQETPLFEANLARRIHVASYGLLDYVVKLLEGAVSLAAASGSDVIDLPVLAAAFRDKVWRDVPERLNPFHPESPLRPLDRIGEVFYLHTQLDPVGSPVARLRGMRAAKGGAHG